MTRSKMSRAAGAVILAMVVCVWLAPVAQAQVPGVGGTVGDIGGAVGGGSDGGSTGIVDGITDPVTGGSGGTSSGGTTDPIGEVVEQVDDKVGETKDTAQDTANDTGGSLGNVGSGAGNAVGGVVGGTTDAVDKTIKDLNGSSARNSKSRQEVRHGSTAPATHGSSSQVFGNSLADALKADGKLLAAAKAEGKAYATSGVEASEQSVISQISKIAAQAVEQAVFPALLIVMVIAFLMVQSRIDGRDPKLALAPVDSEHDLLSFT